MCSSPSVGRNPFLPGAGSSLRPFLGALGLLEEAIELCGLPHELMTDNGTPFVAITRSMLSRFQRSLAELSIRHIRTQIDTPWTNGRAEAFWATLQAEVLDRQQLADLAAAETAVTAYAGYYNYHRLHGELAWQTPAERFDGAPFTDRGFASVPALAAVADLLDVCDSPRLVIGDRPSPVDAVGLRGDLVRIASSTKTDEAHGLLAHKLGALLRPTSVAVGRRLRLNSRRRRDKNGRFLVL